MKDFEKIKKIIDALPNPIFFKDIEGRYTGCNKAFSDIILGIPFEHIIGKKVSDFPEQIPDEFVPRYIEQDKRILAFGRNEVFETKVRCADGIIREFLLQKALIKNEDGSPMAITGTMMDITERKKAELELRLVNIDLEARVLQRTALLEEALDKIRMDNEKLKQTELELNKAKDELSESLKKEIELNEMKSRFISMISHEYKNPLSVIMSSSYLIEKFFENHDSAQFMKFLDKIKASVKQMTDLLEEVLTIGKYESGNGHLNIKQLDLVELSNELIEEVGVIFGNKHKIELDYKNGKCNIESDEKLLKLILSNLITNAVKYSPVESPVNIKIDDDTDKILIKVEDKGIGIKPEDCPRIFDNFYRGSNVSNISGTGLGLAITKKCVESLEGEISVKSDVASGTTFLVNLPKKKADS